MATTTFVTETFTWIDPSGTQTPFKAAWNAQIGQIAGRFMPEVITLEDLIPLQAGGRHRASVHAPRDFTLPILIVGTEMPDVRTRLRQLITAMDPTKGAGRVRLTTVLGDQREIVCYYTGGFDLPMTEVVSNGRRSQTALAQFRSYDPYWQDIADTSMSWSVNLAPVFFPFFPLRLTSSVIAVQQTVNNTGDQPTFPVFTITGPGGSGIQLNNDTTGETLTLSSTVLGFGETIVVDTRPGHKTVTKGDGTNLFGDLDINSSLWGLQPGNNAISLGMGGSVIGYSQLQMNFRPKYLTP